MANSSKSSGCIGCLGTLVPLTFLGFLVFGGGIVLKVGNFGFAFNNPVKVDQQQVITDYRLELENEKNIAQTAVDNYRKQFNSGKCEEIYNQSSDIFKSTASKSIILNNCSTLSQKLGVLNSTLFLDWFVQSDNTSNYILMRYSTKFSSFLTQEQFVWRIKQNQAELISYEVFPLDFGNKNNNLKSSPKTLYSY